MEPQDSGEEDGANIDLDAQRKGKCAVIKTSTRQVLSLLIINADVCLFWKKKFGKPYFNDSLLLDIYCLFSNSWEVFFFNEFLLFSDIFPASHRLGWSRKTEPRRHCGETKIPVFGKYWSINSFAFHIKDWICCSLPDCLVFYFILFKGVNKDSYLILETLPQE